MSESDTKTCPHCGWPAIPKVHLTGHSIAEDVHLAKEVRELAGHSPFFAGVAAAVLAMDRLELHSFYVCHHCWRPFT